MPPLICFAGFGRVWRLTIATCSTSTKPRSTITSRTRPVLPLSLPEITLTVSFLRICMRFGTPASLPPNILRGILYHLRSQRHDLHKTLVTQFAGDRPEHARSDRLADFVDQNGGI